MNRYLLSIIFIFSTVYFSFAQSPYWVSTIKSQGYDDCRDLYTSPSGDVYVTGQIEYTASFDGYNLSSEGSHDIFIARYDIHGNLIWAKRAGGSDGDIGKAVAVDDKGNVFITGEFESTSNFDAIIKTAQGSNNMFIAKYDSSGNAIWVKSIGTNSGSTIGYGIACDATGNVYACGTTSAKAIYSGSTLFTSRGSKDIILIKFSADGTYLWHKQIGGTDSDEGFGLAVKDDNLYITGSIEGDAKFTSSFTLNDIGGKDFFLARYDTSGNFIWAKAGGGSSDEFANNITINDNGNIVCTGDFRGNATFGSHTISSNGSNDMFVVAYDDNGNALWAISAGGNDIDFGNHISNDKNGNLFIGGTFADDATFGQTTISSNGEEDVFLASYDSTGNFRFVKGFGGPHHDRGNGTGADQYGNIYFSGEYWDNISFEHFNIAGVDLYDGFIVRFGNLPSCGIAISTSAVINPSCFGCSDGTIAILVNGGTPPYTFAWSNGSSSEDLYNIPAGLYNVCITDMNGCYFCHSFNVFNSTLGIDDNENSAIRIFPNPVQSDVFIQLNKNLSVENYQFEFTNSVGVKLKTFNIYSENTILPLTEFSNGIYFIKIIETTTGQIKISPIIIQK